MIIRTELANGGHRIICSNQNLYNLTITLHGLIMIFFLVMPNLYSGFGNYFLPIYIAGSEVAYPRVNNISLLLLPLSYMILLLSLFSEYGYGTGWTIYPPLSTRSPELFLMIISLYIVGLSSVLASINFVSTSVWLRSVGMTLGMMSYFVWAILITAAMLLLTIPILTSALLMLLSDMTYSTIFFDPEFSGDPVLYQHLFWIFGHPEVYIIILPAFGVISQIINNYGLLGGSSMLLAMGCIGIVGSLVWAHHMNTVGLDTDTRAYFTTLTILIALPTGTKIFNWVSTSKVYLDPAMLTALLFVLTFTLGGTTGIVLGSGGLDVVLHDTYYVIAHFHFVLSVGAISGILAGFYYYGTALGFTQNTSSQIILLVMFMTGVIMAMTPLHSSGFNTVPRRIFMVGEEQWSSQFLASIGTYVTLLALFI